jgi:hypothetical protein
MLESRGIVPCVTAICGRCGRTSVVLHEGARDPLAHALALYERVGRFIE